MISRYTRPEMAKIWTEQEKYLYWLKVEIAVCEKLASERMIPRKDWLQLKPKLDRLLKEGGVDATRVEEHEKVTRHDLIAFTTAVAEKVGPLSRYVHFGLTSSDVVDTALSLQIQASGNILLRDFEALLKNLKRLAKKYQKTTTIGRSHGIFAEPTSFGLKFLGFYSEWNRNWVRIKRSLDGLAYGKLSGAVGVSPHWSPAFEKAVLKRLFLKREPVSTQVIPRDRHAEFFNAVALCGSSLERMAIEFRHLQRSEVSEVYEGFKKGQKGSSAMPHKKNPISSENLTGLARLLRSYAQAGLENVALWHERDISHSSVERVIFPDAFIILNYALVRMNDVLQGLEVETKNVARNLESAGPKVFSGHVLLALVKAGAQREEAYYWVQECAISPVEKASPEAFIQRAVKHPEILKFLKPAEIRKIASYHYQLRHVSEIYFEALKSQTD